MEHYAQPDLNSRRTVASFANTNVTSCAVNIVYQIIIGRITMHGIFIEIKSVNRKSTTPTQSNQAVILKNKMNKPVQMSFC